jgi:hypothetical protein
MLPAREVGLLSELQGYAGIALPQKVATGHTTIALEPPSPTVLASN